MTPSTRHTCLGGHEQADAPRFFPQGRAALEHLLEADGTCCVQGSGLSLSGAGFGAVDRIVSLRSFERILGFEPEAPAIEVQAGTTLGELYEFLLPHRLYVPVLPGYPDITVGGCIAGDVHGKNPARDGTFCDHVESLVLYHPDHGERLLSRDENVELFELTCGGLGLTGAIVSARIRLSRLHGEKVVSTHHPVADLVEGASCVREHAGDSDLVYSWHDLAAPGRACGAGFVVDAKIVEGHAGEGRGPHRYPVLSTRRRRSDLFAFRPLPMRAINAVYRRRWARPVSRESDLFSAFFPWIRQTAYFRCFGSVGFVEHQSLVPDANTEAFLSAVTRLVRTGDAVPTLASLKPFRGGTRHLRFRGDGVSLSIHVPANAAGLALMSGLDALDAEHGAIPNVIKDARLPAAAVRDRYPDYDAFRAAIAAHDPHRRFQSALSRRIGL